MKSFLVAVVVLASLSCVVCVQPSASASKVLSPLGKLQTELRAAADAEAEALPTGAASRPAVSPVVAPRSASTPAPAPVSPAACWVGQINHCTGENRDWSDATAAGRATQAVIVASLMPGSQQLPAALNPMPSQNIAYGLIEAEAEAGKCSGTCLNKPGGAKCATSWLTGQCPGALVCCVAAARPAAPATTPTTPTTTTTTPATTPTAVAPAATGALTGVSSRVLDPKTELVAKGRTITWAMLTAEQQTNARLLMRYAKQQSISDINALAYIFGTAHWECHLKPIKEYNGSKKRYKPYFGRGFVQLTWRDNYDKFTKLLRSEVGITADLVRNPDLALNPTNAAFIAAYGMKFGTFTTRRLDHYFGNGKADFVGARAIINGSDKAQTIASLARLWVPLTRTLYAL